MEAGEFPGSPPPAPWRALSSYAGFPSRWGLSSLPYSEAPRRWGLGLVLPTPSFFRFCLFPAIYSWSWQRGRPAQSPLGRGWSGVPIVPPADSGCLGGRGRASWSCRCAAEEKLALAGLAVRGRPSPLPLPPAGPGGSRPPCRGLGVLAREVGLADFVGGVSRDGPWRTQLRASGE